MYGGPDRRLDPRADVELVLEVLPASPSERSIRLLTRNVSSSGALCAAPVPLPPNSLLRCRLFLEGEDEEGIATDVIVLRVDQRPRAGGYMAALYFVEMRPEDRDRIRRFVFERLGEARRRPEPVAAAGKP